MLRPVANLLTTAQVAEQAKVSARTVARWVERGQLLPAHRIEGRTGALLFDPETVEAFLTAEAAS